MISFLKIYFRWSTESRKKSKEKAFSLRVKLGEKAFYILKAANWL
jgi:hypothetical protein